MTPRIFCDISAGARFSTLSVLGIASENLLQTIRIYGRSTEQPKK